MVRCARQFLRLSGSVEAEKQDKGMYHMVHTKERPLRALRLCERNLFDFCSLIMI